MPPKKIIAIMSLKGGVAKTTSAVNIAACLAESGNKTLLVDLDPHTGASLHLGYDLSAFDLTISDLLTDPDLDMDEVVVKTGKENLFLIPSNESLANVESELESDMGRENLLLECLEGRIGAYDYTIIDSPPIGSFLLYSVLKASTFVMVPFKTTSMSVAATRELAGLIQKSQRRINPDIRLLGYFGTMGDMRTLESRSSMDEMRQYFKEQVFQTVIPATTILAQAARKGTTALDHARNSKGAIAYKDLVDEMRLRMKKHNSGYRRP